MKLDSVTLTQISNTLIRVGGLKILFVGNFRQVADFEHKFLKEYAHSVKGGWNLANGSSLKAVVGDSQIRGHCADIIVVKDTPTEEIILQRFLPVLASRRDDREFIYPTGIFLLRDF